MSQQPVISIKINCSRIEKERLFKGEKGTYLDATLVPLKQPDQYGNTHFISQNVTKEERAKDIKGAIIGNAKVLERKGEQTQRRPQQASPKPPGGTPF